MAPPTRSTHGFTRFELLVGIAVFAVVFILVSLAIPSVSSTPVRGPLLCCLNNARQIHMATMAMAIDGKINGDPSLAWPGDLKAKGRITTVADFVNVLVRYDYMKPGDLIIFSAPGCKAYPGGTLSLGSDGGLTTPFTEENSAFKVFLVKNDDPPETLFMESKNYTYNRPLNDPNAKPFGDTGFVVIRKNGDASRLRKQQAQSLQIIGKLPNGDSIESAKNCLNPTSH